MSGLVRANNAGQSGIASNVETIDSDDYVDASIDNAHIADDAIDSEHYADGSIDNAHIADDAIDSEHYAAASIDTAHIADLQITTGLIAADAVTAAKIGDNIINSEHYAAASIDTAHIGNLQITTGLIAADAVTAAKIGDNIINSEHYAAASIDNEHLADNAVDTAEMADNAVTLAKMAGGTDGNIISYDASGDPVAIGTGTDGQVLTSTGAGSPPAFEDASGGAWTLLSSVEADGDAYIDLTGADTTKYGGYCVVMKGMRPATNAVEIAMQLGDSSGVHTGGTDYTYSAGHWLTGYSGIQHSYGSSQFQMSYWQDAGNGGDDGYSGTAWVLPGTSGGTHGLTSWAGIISDGACSKGTYYYGRQVGSGYRKSTIALTTVRIKFTSGNITSGIASLYGITES